MKKYELLALGVVMVMLCACDGFGDKSDVRLPHVVPGKPQISQYSGIEYIYNSDGTIRNAYAGWDGEVLDVDFHYHPFEIEEYYSESDSQFAYHDKVEYSNIKQNSRGYITSMQANCESIDGDYTGGDLMEYKMEYSGNYLTRMVVNCTGSESDGEYYLCWSDDYIFNIEWRNGNIQKIRVRNEYEEWTDDMVDVDREVFNDEIYFDYSTTNNTFKMFTPAYISALGLDWYTATAVLAQLDYFGYGSANLPTSAYMYSYGEGDNIDYTYELNKDGSIMTIDHIYDGQVEHVDWFMYIYNVEHKSARSEYVTKLSMRGKRGKVRGKR